MRPESIIKWALCLHVAAVLGRVSDGEAYVANGPRNQGRRGGRSSGREMTEVEPDIFSVSYREPGFTTLLSREFVATSLELSRVPLNAKVTFGLGTSPNENAGITEPIKSTN